MYVPSRVDDPELLEPFMRRHSFAALVSHHGGTILASHLPLLVGRTGPALVLRGCLTRGDPQARVLHGRKVLAIFRGPHAYVPSATSYVRAGPPTWNYAVVHAHGSARVLHEAGAAGRLLTRLAAEHDPPHGERRPDRALPDEETAECLVAFEVSVERVVARFQLSQERPTTERLRIAAWLAKGDPEAQGVAGLIRASLRGVADDLRRRTAQPLYDPGEA